MAKIMTTARFGPQTVRVQAAQYDGGPRTVAFSAPLRLSEDDMVAALFRAAEIGLEADELDDLEFVREMVADQVINAGLDQINEAYARMCALEPGTVMHEFTNAMRQAVRRAFAPALVPTPRTRPASDRRALATAAG
ncbi:hypothetical protein FHU38_000240 [Saccharomonospora amisosensis]|uniref:Uncharacterized protein n=1 Tax=Saccharomonospora amisosensis TaxID=1128677 RepID=A0A7X5ZNX2_9PSEU|nr:hypothetical protein [Saccharomonospora amisosensis]NIJ09896.1 hypothetical protein [Saccharomonospora amisosensis]